MEIERKFLLSKLPPAELLRNEDKLMQAYLLTGKGELRIRSKTQKFFMTVKGEGTISREEWETEIPEWVFNQLWYGNETRCLVKLRYKIRHMGWWVEVDEYFAKLHGLITLECEFSSLEEAESFVLPPWAKDAVEVTEDQRYKNKSLTLIGLPT